MSVEDYSPRVGNAYLDFDVFYIMIYYVFIINQQRVIEQLNNLIALKLYVLWLSFLEHYF